MSIIINPYRFSSSGSWEFEEDFSTYSTQSSANAVWVPIVTASHVSCEVDISNDYLKLVSLASTSKRYGSNTRSLTETDDTAFVLRYKHHWISSTMSGGNSSRYLLGVFSSNSSSNSGVAQDCIGLMSQLQATIKKYYACAGDNTTTTTSDIKDHTFGTFTPTNNQDRYIETIRTSSTSYTLDVFSDSDYSTNVDTSSNTCASTIVDLDYVGIKGNTGSGSSTQSYWIDDVKFANGVTVAP
jgi:hypothetical protein